MTPSERLALRVLLDEYLHPERSRLHPENFGPYGRAGERLGLEAYRVARIEDDQIGWPNADLPAGGNTVLQVKRLCDLFHTTPDLDVLERLYARTD